MLEFLPYIVFLILIIIVDATYIWSIIQHQREIRQHITMTTRIIEVEAAIEAELVKQKAIEKLKQIEDPKDPFINSIEDLK